jgi:hypothetical protein
MKPQRIRLSRRKGWRMPANTVKADRTTDLGNPFIVGKHGTRENCVDLHKLLLGGLLIISFDRECIEAQRAHRAYVKANRKRLRGKSIGCWCSLDGPCHGNTLIEVFNP